MDKIKNKIYNTWKRMRQRCFNKKHPKYKYYGGRGISIDIIWDNFDNFYFWSINNGYKTGLSIDRIDNNQNYSPSNCRWVNQKVQQNNKSSNHIIKFNGTSKNIKEWAEELKIPYERLKSRIRRGWSASEAINNKKYKNKYG